MMSVNFLLRELHSCGAVLSTFELVQALRKLGYDANIVSHYRNKELESYFGILPTTDSRGGATNIAVSPGTQAEYAYVRTRDDKWLSHSSRKIAVSRYIGDWLSGKGHEVVAVIGNGTHERFYDMQIERDIDVLIVGNLESNKNIGETINEAKKLGNRIVWMGRDTNDRFGVETITSPTIQEIPKIYNRAKTFLSMSHDEGWGRPVAEATACGVPNVINRNGGNREIEIVTWESIAKKLIEIL
jgi:glycosyltransferase involved in cell wall biosynthesis